MKRRKMFFVSSLAASALVSLIAVPGAMSGRRIAGPIVIHNDGTSIFAGGSLSDPRNIPTGPNLSYIGCSARYYYGSLIGVCSAYDNSTWQSAYCSTSNAVAVQLIESMKGDSYVGFSYPAGGSNCNDIQVYSGSYIAPKQPWLAGN